MRANGSGRLAQDRLIDHILDTLERERDLLIAGDYAALADLTSAREASLARLQALVPAPGPAEMDALDTLRAALVRNERLLAAALDGVAAGRQRVEEIARAEKTLPSYAADGTPLDRAAAVPSGRRA